MRNPCRSANPPFPVSAPTLVVWDAMASGHRPREAEAHEIEVEPLKTVREWTSFFQSVRVAPDSLPEG